MNAVISSFDNPLRLVQNLVILVLAGLLVFYHLTMLHDLARGDGLSRDTAYNAIQGALRLAIVASLTAVVIGNQNALWAMWLSIGGLIGSHYWAHYGPVTAEFTAVRHPLSYLKGIIIPSIITAAFLYRRGLG